MKSLLKSTDAESLVNRVQTLQAANQPLWGKMNATEMLLHCNRVNTRLLTERAQKKGTRLKQYAARILVLYILPHFPKNARTPRANDTKGQVDVTAFADQKETFIQLIRRFPVHEQAIELPHPYFGDLNTNQWGLAAYKHVDHHLRQFGV